VLEYEFENYDCIIMADILHYLQPEEQKLVIERCISKLNEGGVIIIREGDKDVSGKHKRTKLSEFFSTKVVNFNKIKTGDLSFLSGSMIKEIAEARNMDCREMADSKVTSNTIFILKHQ
jgi:2-polyprenyl-3-methyl-5-hydroxy-6-metoxy-1,4-benzoquinol methylase